MDWPKQNKFSQKQPPDKKNKPKYVLKEQYTDANQKKGQETQIKQEKVKPYQRANQQQYQRPKKQFVEKPVLLSRNSSMQPMINCLICSEGIKKREPIWTCQQCRISLHLRCIKKWIQKSNPDKEGKKHLLFNWACIQCKTEYNQTMPDYYCFCGKFKNPEFDHDLQPHSCGQFCQRKRGGNCPHLCPLVCHSGKCKSCEYDGAKASCYCGKSQRATKCSEDRPIFQCGKKCQKLLNCGKHKCQRNCHQGQCYPCKKKKMVNCYCGKNEEVIDCAEKSYQCEQACERLLDCGYHKCEKDCHPEQCGRCVKTPQLQKTCPCGRYSLMMISQIERQSCKDPIPSCGMPCKKILLCGHECSRMCHQGKCSECKVIVTQKCDCTSIQRKIQCFKAKATKDQFKCDTVCKKKRACGQHNCNTECCKYRLSPFPENHPCQLNCQRMLNCQRHTCDMPCHAGLCKKCPVLYSQPQPCPCGATSLKPPVVCGTLTPQCDNVCNKTMQCTHPCKQLCHYGQCRCFQQVSVPCRCGKQNIKTTCGRQALCLTKCPKQLPCGHKCLVQCHSGTCSEWLKSSSCLKKCDKIRSNCGHRCKMICHPDKKCEQFTCQAEILIKCECGNRQKQIPCGSKGLNQNGNIKVKQILCNSKCQNMKRFDILYKGKQIYYPNGLIQFGFKNWNYLTKIEQRLENFILKSDEHFIEIDFKLDNHSRVALLNLFENHYHLNTHFYRHMKGSSFTLMQTENTMIPNPPLSEYIKKVSKGEIKRINLPFQYTVKFEGQSKERTDAIIGVLKPFLHKYYIQRKDKLIHVHFWDKTEALKGLNILDSNFVNVEFKGEQNIVDKDDQNGQQFEIEGAQIIQTEVTPTIFIPSTKVKQAQQKQQIKNQNQKQQPIESSAQQPNISQNVSSQKPIEAKRPKIITTTKKISNVIIKPPHPFMIPNSYPESSKFVQDIYQLDADQLFHVTVDWKKTVVDVLLSKNMGIEAMEWRIRAFTILGLFYDIENREEIMNQQFTKIVEMYDKDKKKAKRILSIQKVDTKKVQQQMSSNHIYLSDHEPEILAYSLLHNYFAKDKQQILPTQECSETQQVQKVLQIIQSVEQPNFQQFYNSFQTSDYVLACALKPFVFELRRNFLIFFTKKRKIAAQNLWTYLFFQTQEEFLQFLQETNHLKVHKKYSKSQKQQVYIYTPEDQKVQSEQQENKFIVDLKQQDKLLLKQIHEKRNKKYFIAEPQEFIDGCYMTRSFFAFGDFKQNVNKKYMITLCRKLKDLDD